MLALLVTAVAPSAAFAYVPPDPSIHVEDAPVTRNRVVKLSVLSPGGGDVAEYRISNSNTTTDGKLNTGISLSGDQGWHHSLDSSLHRKIDWTLPNSDGTHRVYAQVHFVHFEWSDVVYLDLTLDRSGGTSLYVDSNVLWQPGSDIHTRSVAPSTPVVVTAGTTALGSRIAVKDGLWAVTLTYDGAIVAGSYPVDGPGDGNCAEACVEVAYNGGPYNSNTCNAGDGVFDITEISTDTSGDMRTLTADFDVTCGQPRIAGSIRYGSTSTTHALDQDLDEWLYGQLLLGSTPTVKTLRSTSSATSPISSARPLSAVPAPEIGRSRRTRAPACSWRSTPHAAWRFARLQP